MGFIDYFRMLLMDGWQNNLPDEVQFVYATVGAVLMILLLGTGFFVLLVHNRSERKLLANLAVLVSAAGFMMYLSGYLFTPGTGLTQAMFRAMFSTIRMFIGEEDFGGFMVPAGSVPTTTWFVILFWATHVMALFLSSSIAITIFGRGLYQKLKLWFGFFHDRYHIIFGVTNQSLFYGESILKPQQAEAALSPEGLRQNAPGKRRKQSSMKSEHGGSRPCVIYFASEVSQADRERIFKMGAILHHKPLLAGGEINHRALRCMGFRYSRHTVPGSNNAVFFRHMRMLLTYPRWKKYRFYLFAKDDELNLMVIRQILKYLAQTCQVPVERVRILMHSENTRQYNLLQTMRADSLARGVHDMKLWSRYNDKDGRTNRARDGNPRDLKARLKEMLDCYEHPSATYQVGIFDESDIACAGLFRCQPIYKMLGLKDGKQTQPFAVMIFGGGEIGIGVLRRAIAQGQFESSEELGKNMAFRAVVVDRESDAVESRFRLYYPEAADTYNVEFVKDDVFGKKATERLKALGNSLKLVVFALGDDKVNAAAARDISGWFEREGKNKPVIAVHIRDEEGLLEEYENAEQSSYENRGYIRFGAFRDVFSAAELFGRRSRSRLIRAVLLKNLYDTVYTARMKVIEERGSLMVQQLLSGEQGAEKAFLNQFSVILDEEMQKVRKSFLEDLFNEPENRKEWLKEQYRVFYDDTLFSQLSCIAAAENLEVYQGQRINEQNYMNEHLRWNAFSRIHGWRSMSFDEFMERAGALYMTDLQRCLYKYIKASDEREKLSAITELVAIRLENKPFWEFKFQKNEKTMKHACITDWEGLRQLDLNETMIRTELYKTITGVLGGFEGKESLDETRRVETNKKDSGDLQEEIIRIDRILLRFLTDIPCYELYDKAFVDNADKIHDAVLELEKNSL